MQKEVIYIVQNVFVVRPFTSTQFQCHRHTPQIPFARMDQNRKPSFIAFNSLFSGRAFDLYDFEIETKKMNSQEADRTLLLQRRYIYPFCYQNSHKRLVDASKLIAKF